MLNQSDRHRVLKFIRLLCTVGLLPLEVDVDCWDIQPGVKSQWKRLVCWTSFAIFFAHMMYKVLSLAYAFAFMRCTPLHQMVLDMILAGPAAVLSLWYYILYVKYPGTNATLMRMTLRGTGMGCEHTCATLPFDSL